MHKAILNESFLKKNIDKINFYSSEEKRLLNDIVNGYLESSESYKSDNMTLFLENLEYIQSKIDVISVKRAKYSDVLSNVVIQYHELSDETVKMFDRGE